MTTGLRSGELCGLKWRDVDLAAGSLHVRQQAQRTREGWTFTEPKTGAGRRSVTLPTVAIDALKVHRVSQNEERLALGPAWDDLDLVFANERGRPLERQNVLRRSSRPLLERAGLRPIRFHDLRHSAATLLLAEGVHPKVVQERLGLDDQRHDGHLQPRSADDAARGRDRHRPIARRGLRVGRVATRVATRRESGRQAANGCGQ